MKKHFYIISAILAFTIWGIFPLIYKIVKNVSPLEILSFRIVVSFVFLLIIASFSNNLKNLFKSLTFNNFLFLILSTLLVLTTWFVFIVGTTTENVLDVSLGYFICPIIEIFLGVVLLREKLNFYQKLGLLFTIIGICILVFHCNKIPYIGFILGFSFSFYTIIRKIIKIKPLQGLIIETMFLTPFFLAYIIYLYLNSKLYFNLYTDPLTSSTLIFIGILAPIAMFLYLYASKNISLTSLGFLHYIEPSMHFFLAILIFKESFDLVKLISFSFIWLALIVISFGPYFNKFLKIE